MITMRSRVFNSSFEALRSRILNQHTILSKAHQRARAFDCISAKGVSTTAFMLEDANKPNCSGTYTRLVEGSLEAERLGTLAKAITQGSAT